MTQCKWIFSFCRKYFVFHQNFVILFELSADSSVFFGCKFFGRVERNASNHHRYDLENLFSARPPVSLNPAQICNSNCETCLRTTNGFLDSSHFLRLRKASQISNFPLFAVVINCIERKCVGFVAKVLNKRLVSTAEWVVHWERMRATTSNCGVKLLLIRKKQP